MFRGPSEGFCALDVLGLVEQEVLLEGDLLKHLCHLLAPTYVGFGETFRLPTILVLGLVSRHRIVETIWAAAPRPCPRRRQRGCRSRRGCGNPPRPLRQRPARPISRAGEPAGAPLLCLQAVTISGRPAPRCAAENRQTQPRAHEPVVAPLVAKEWPAQATAGRCSVADPLVSSDYLQMAKAVARSMGAGACLMPRWGHIAILTASPPEGVAWRRRLLDRVRREAVSW